MMSDELSLLEEQKHAHAQTVKLLSYFVPLFYK